MADHAMLSASGANKWINCPPSARFEQQFPDTHSEYAAEGSVAHSVAELALRKALIEPMTKQAYTKRLKKIQENSLFKPEMLEHAQTYVDFINKIAHSYPVAPHVAAELRLDFSHVVPGGFGTGDCVVISGSDLYIVDYKYGQGVRVDAEDNPQMRLYALGALARYSLLYNVQTVSMTIVQPRLDNVITSEMSVEELTEWGKSIKPIAQMAAAGEGESKAGDWCKFCRARAVCRHRAAHYLAMRQKQQDPDRLAVDELGEILREADALKSWVSDVQEWALSALLNGEAIPGWKAVEGRSNRQFTDTDRAFEAAITLGWDENTLYERKPITLTAVEKLMGKKDFNDVLSSFIFKPPGKPTLAPETDNRPPISGRVTAAEAFKEEN